MKQVYSILSSAALVGLTTTAGMADSIAPDSFGAALNIGESVTIRKTVTVDEGAPTSSKVDVYFLADETGSMGSEIGAIKSSAASILSSTAGLGDVQFGVGGYRDVGDSWVFRQLTDLTGQAGAQAAINNWAHGGGGDTPEANLAALEGAATGTSWRAGSERILVWFGDARGHDPRAGSTEASATAALVANGINVQAVDVGHMDSSGQATRIAAATGGTVHSGISTGSIVDTITDAISTAIANYTVVGLDLSEVPTGVTVTSTPAHVGTFDRSTTRSFDFDVTFTGDAAGDYGFNIYGTVDGGRVAAESDKIRVRDGGGGGETVPDGGHAVALFGLALLGLGAMRKKLGR